MLKKQILFLCMVAAIGTVYEWRSQLGSSGAFLATGRDGPLGYVEEGEVRLPELRPVRFLGQVAAPPVTTSVDGAAPGAPPAANCSVGSLTCSIQTGAPNTGNACSVNHDQNVATCSTTGTSNTHGTCSASVNPGSGPANPVICSAVATNNNATCSVNPNDNDTASCSTFGGQTSGGAGGNSACSAGGTSNVPGNQTTSCSVSGMPGAGAPAPSCSTFSNPAPADPANPDGHQVCSAGRTGPGDTASCSVSGNIAVTCSVNSQPESTTGAGNKCSVSHGEQGSPDGTVHCSISSNNNAGARCSIQESQTNVQCTMLNPGLPATQTCSVQTGSQGKCSILNSDGTVTPPDANGLCNHDYHHHPGWPVAPAGPAP